MVGKKRFLSRLAPLSMGFLALAMFAGCNASINVRHGRYYAGHIWNSDPYCNNYYSYDYGCRYYGNDGLRINIIHNRRHNRFAHRGIHRGIHRGFHLGHHRAMLTEANATPTASSPTTWQQEFNLNNGAVALLNSSFNNAMSGNLEQLKALGMSYGDIQAMTNFQLPSDASIATAASVMKVDRQDLRDFLEVFLIRMKTAFAHHERIE